MRIGQLQKIVLLYVKEMKFSKINIVDEFYREAILRAMISSGNVIFEKTRFGIRVRLKRSKSEMDETIFIKNEKISEVFDILL